MIWNDRFCLYQLLSSSDLLWILEQLVNQNRELTMTAGNQSDTKITLNSQQVVANKYIFHIWWFTES